MARPRWFRAHCAPRASRRPALPRRFRCCFFEPLEDRRPLTGDSGGGEEAAWVFDLHPLNPFERKLDGQWEGSHFASDGKLYFGSSSHAPDTAARFFQYDPATEQVTQIGPDVSRILGEDPLAQVPQGKLHSPIVESHGWLFTATHLANYWNEAQDSYTGSHLFGYQLGSLEAGEPVFRDLGIVRERFSTYSALALDPRGDYLWSVAVPFAVADQAATGTHLYRTHLATGNKQDYGAVAAGAAFAMHVDNRGDAWLTLFDGGDKLFVARADSGTIESFEHALPTMTHQYKPGQPSAYQQHTWWNWGRSIDGERFLFTMADARAPYADVSGGSLWEFDASKTLDGDLSDAFREIAWIGGSNLTKTYQDGTVYFVRRSDGFHRDVIEAVQGNGEYWDSARDDGVRLHLYSVDVEAASGQVIDWGLIRDAGGRVPWRIGSIAANSARQEVYLVGDWVMKETDPVEWRALRHDGGTSDTYTLHVRGQALAVARTDIVPPPPSPDRPEVSVSVSDADAGEPDNDGEFTLSRTGDLQAPLTVSFTLAGSATAGLDYFPLHPSVTFPAGVAAVAIPVVVLEDELVESPETVALVLSAGGDYELGHDSRAELTILSDDVEPPVFDPDLLAYWKLDETTGTTAGDSARQHAATLVNGPVWSPGHLGGGLTLDGEDDYVAAGTQATITGKGGFSVAVWVRTTARRDQVLLQQRGPDGYNGEYQLLITSAGIPRFWTFGDSDFGARLEATQAIHDGRWHQVTAVRQADGTSQVYIDGRLDGEQSAPSRTMVPLSVYLGADMRGGSKFLQGGLDDVRIYNRALDAHEVRALASAYDPTRAGARNDHYTTSEDAQLSVAVPGVLANDVGEDLSISHADSFSVREVPVQVASGGSFTYDPRGTALLQALTEGQTATDVFQYTLASGPAPTGTVTVTVAGRNDPPTASPLTLTISERGSGLSGQVEADDADSDDHPGSLVYTLVAAPERGRLADLGGGQFRFEPAGEFTDLGTGQQAAVTLTYRVTDRHGATAEAVVTVLVEGVNDAPELAGMERARLAWTGSETAQSLTSTITLRDPDSAQLSGATVRIAANYQEGQDLLSFADTPTISGSWDASTGTLMLQGLDTLANYEAALRRVQYQNLFAEPYGPTRTVTIQVTDGEAGSNLAARQITVTIGEAVVEWYVAPTGSISGDGSRVHPWDLTTVLKDNTDPESPNSLIKPGDTIWLLPGTYSGSFTSHLWGTPDQPIIVRNHDGGRATIDHPTGKGLDVRGGGDVWFWGLEFTSSHPTRASQESGSWPSDILYGAGADVTRPTGIKFINNIVHEGATGIGMWVPGLDAEATGNLVYYAGWNAPDRAHGHGFYVQNKGGTKKLLDNIVFYNADHGLQAYGSESASIDNFVIEGNILFNNGELFGRTDGRNLLVGGGQGARKETIVNNYVYRGRSGFGQRASDVMLGYGPRGMSDSTVSGNYIAGSLYLSGAFTNVALSGNTIYGYVGSDPASNVKSLYPDNTYLSSRPSGVQSFVRANPYEAGRANIAIYNWDLRNSVHIDVAHLGLVPGQQYELRNATDYFSDVIFGTYEGGVLEIPMTGHTVAAPVGISTPPSTFPEFGAFVLIARDLPPQTPPVLSGIEESLLAYAENDPATPLSSSIRVSDVDHASLVRATVRITGNYQPGEDRLTFARPGRISASWDAASGLLTLRGTDTLANYEAALRAVRYHNGSDDPNLALRTVTFKVDDSRAESEPVTRNIEITAVNDPPVLENLETSALAYAENDSELALTATLAVDDPDTLSLAGATVRVSGNYQRDQDVLSFPNTDALVGSWDAESGTLTLSGSASLAHYEAALRTVQYRNTSEHPDESLRTVTFTVHDGRTLSNSVTRTIAVQRVNDAPRAEPDTYAAAADTPLDVPPAGLLANDTDVDQEDVLEVAAGELVSRLGATVVLRADGSFQYDPRPAAALQALPEGHLTEDHFHYSVHDGTWSSKGAVTIVVRGVNNAPTAASPVLTVGEDGPAVSGAIEADDVDTDEDGSTLTYELVALPGRGSVEDLGQGLFRFDPAGQFEELAVGQEVPVTFTYLISDKCGASVESRVTVLVQGRNDAPVLAGIEPTPLAYRENDSAHTIAPAITVRDVDSARLASARVSITANYQPGQDQLWFTRQGGITGNWDPATGSLLLGGEDSLANYQAVLRSVHYWNSSDHPRSQPRTVTFTVDDGLTPGDPGTRVIAVEPINDVPALAGVESSSLTYVESEPPKPLTSLILVSDPDSTTLSGGTVTFTRNYQRGQDELLFTSTATITATWNAATGTLTLTGQDSVANYQAALRSVRYRNTQTRPSALVRTVSFQVDDGFGGSNLVSRSIAVEQLNDAAARRIDFNTAGSATENGFIGLGTANAFTPARGFGWSGSVPAIDRGGPHALLRDGHLGMDKTFLMNLPSGTYVVNVTLGDPGSVVDSIDVYAEGVLKLDNVSSPLGQSVHRSFVTTVTDGQLTLRLKKDGGTTAYPYWVINALEVRPSQGALTLNNQPADPFVADGRSVATFQGHGARAHALITVTTSLGTLVGVDGSASYGGFQVQANASGDFSFSIQAGSTAGVAHIRFEEVTGASSGSATRTYQPRAWKQTWGALQSRTSARELAVDSLLAEWSDWG